MKYQLSNLIDFEKVNALLEGFYKTTGFTSAISDLEGKILTKSTWRKICADFHRIHPETEEICKISHLELAAKKVGGEKYHFLKCFNGLFDAVVPIVINGEHIANLFSGQFLFEKPNREFFTEQAGKYNFHVTKYLDALGKVPVVSEESVKTALDFLMSMVQLISDTAAQKLKQVELNEALRNSEERFRLLYNNSPDILVSVSPDDATILFCNDTIQKKTGYSNEEIIGSPIFNMYHNDCLEDVKETFEQFTKNGEVKNRELILKRKDGSKIDVSLNACKIKDETGKILYSMSSWRDISERKLVEIELVKAKENAEISNNYLDSIINNIGDPVFVKDDQSRLLLVNNAFCALFNLSRDQIIGKTLAEDVSPTEQENFIRIDNQVLTDGIENNNVESLSIRGNKTKIITTRKTRYIDNTGKKFLVGIIHDITEQKRAEEEIIKHKNNLEELVKARTLELESKYADMELMNKMFVGRELRKVELKAQIIELTEKLKNKT